MPLSADLKTHWDFNLRLLGLRLLSLSCLALLSDLSLWHFLILRHLLIPLRAWLRPRIEDWRFSRTLVGLKIAVSSGLFLENLQSRIEGWRLKILQDSSWRIFNPGLKIEEWRFSSTLAGESSIQDWRLKIPQDSSWRIFNPGENL